MRAKDRSFCFLVCSLYQSGSQSKQLNIMKGFKDYSGVIAELVAGTWRDPSTGEIQRIPVSNIVIADSLDGIEAELIGEQHAGKSIVVVSDERTRAALGKRVFEALKPLGNVKEYVWEHPHCSEQGIEELMAAVPDAEALVAIGSGTLSDSVKYGTFLTGREYSVFPTSPMNAYTTPTASVSSHGFKKSLTCHSARGAFFDLAVLSKCPQRLIAAAFADVVCRTTSQVDWLLSHLFFDSPYKDTAYTLLAYDEESMMTNADRIVTGDSEALAMLTRSAAIMGLGTSFTGTTHSGSMAEHMISHYVDMFAGDKHPGSSHGEQVGVATLTMCQLQNQILAGSQPPILSPTVIPEDELRARFGGAVETMIEESKKKALTREAVDRLNTRLASNWEGIAGQLRAVALPYERLYDSMRAAGCKLTGVDLGLEPEFYRGAIRYSRFIRDRFSMLDVAGDSGLLDAFVRNCK
jgi:glycerol-1-phosphate dehydrogenase [NAD(P)+]